jgi:hypothetical protein
MSIFESFWRDRRGTAMQTLGLTAGAIAIASMAGAHLLDKAAHDGGLPHIAIIEPAAQARIARNFSNISGPAESGRPVSTQQVTVDYTPTASIPANLSQPIILDPCTGARK